MKIKFLLLSFLLLFMQDLFAQSCPPNIDFEKGNFSSWQAYQGNTEARLGKNIINLDTSSPASGRHEIITAASLPRKDPYGNFPVLCPYGGKYSVKLGNNLPGAEAEGLSYTFTIPTTVDTFTFTYFYAVVLEDPDHAVEEQPRFFVTAYEVETGNLINCASYDYVSNGTLPGFQVSPGNSGVLFRNWSPTSLQFAGLQGKEVRLEFKTADCTLGGHFGYAYLDVGSGCSNIMATAPYCRETNSLLLNAPYGFKTYTWYNQSFTDTVGTDQFLTLSPPPADKGIFYVDVIPYAGYGCRDTLQAIVTPLPVPDTPVGASYYTFCQFEYAPPLEAQVQPGNDLIWYTSETGGTGSFIAPVPSTAVAGEYSWYVTQKVLFGCESFRKKITVTIKPTPSAGFMINNPRQCLNGNQFIFSSTANNLYKAVFTWDLADGKTISSAKDTILPYKYTRSGHMWVKLTVTNDSSCAREIYNSIVVVAKPVANFNYPPVICEKQTPVTITDQSSVPDGTSWVTNWWWNINGNMSNVQHPGTFTPTAAGPLPVKLVVKSQEGCVSDTAVATLPVYHKPVTSFDFSRLLCDNEMISFTDQSFIPNSYAAESITTFTWTFNNSRMSSLQHPSLQFISGQQKARLITQTNFGCVSAPVESTFIIHEKPQMSLNINDSCVFRTIKYMATDLKGTVDKFYWNFGNGLKEGPSLTSRSYVNEGDHSFTLLSKTIHGCKDTIIRPFAIYDNKVFAGRDTIVAMEEPMQLDAQGGPGAKFLWSPSTGLNDPTVKSPIALWDKDQRYQLDAWTKEGCDSHTKILVRRYKGPDIYIPNAFSPNRDGHNELLKVFPVGIKTFSYFSVFNRWGERVYHSTNHQQGWDGRFRNMDVSGTFVVVAQAIDYRGRLMTRKGTVTITR
jgi:gliding motility-associated-like protein